MMKSKGRMRPPRQLSSVIRHSSLLVWQWLREVSGEAAYERYARSHSTAMACGRGQAPSGRTLRVNPALPYLQWLEAKYSRPCRCC